MKITEAWLRQDGEALAFTSDGDELITVVWRPDGAPGLLTLVDQVEGLDDTWLPLKTSDGQPCTDHECPDPRHADRLPCGHSRDQVENDEVTADVHERRCPEGGNGRTADTASAHVVEAISNNILGTTAGTVWQGGNVTGGLHL